jgi:hypothetical protein
VPQMLQISIKCTSVSFVVVKKLQAADETMSSTVMEILILTKVTSYFMLQIGVTAVC